MTWTKLSDDYTDDCWTLSDAAFRAHTEALVWNNRKLCDLVISKSDMRRALQAPDPSRAIDELLEVGFWSDTGDAYIIRHHGSYQRTREEVVKQQERNRQNGQKGGRPRKPVREQATDLTQEQKTQVGSQMGSKTQVGYPVANPSGNPQGRDRTGRDYITTPSNETSHVLDDEAAMYEDPDYIGSDPFGGRYPLTARRGAA